MKIYGEVVTRLERGFTVTLRSEAFHALTRNFPRLALKILKVRQINGEEYLTIKKLY